MALQYIARDVTVMLYKALGGDAFLAKLRGWVEWLIAHAPQISAWITRVLVPILKDTLHVLQDVWKVVEALARAFVKLIGALSGDNELKNGALTFDNLGKAIDKAADYMVRFVDAVTSAELVVIDLFNALVDLLHLDFKGAWGDAKSAGGDLTGGGALVLGGIGAFLGRGALRAGAGGVIEGAGAAGVAGSIGSILAILGLGSLAKYLSQNDDLSQNTFAGRELAWENQFGILRWLNNLGGRGQNVADTAQRYGVDPALAAAVAKQESGGRQFDRAGNVITSSAGALGMFQLMPSTARTYGVDPYSQSGNIDGGIHFLSNLLRKYGNVSEALAAYNWGPGNLDAALRRHGGQFALDYLPRETRKYISDIEGHMSGGITVHSTVNVAGTNATPQQIKEAAASGAEDGIRRATRKDLVNSQGVYA